MLSARAQTSLSEIVTRYITHRKVVDRLAGSTAATMRATLVEFSNIVGPIEIGRLRRSHVIKYLRVKEHLSDNTLRLYISRLRVFSRWCRSERFTNTDFMLTVNGPRSVRTVPRCLTAEEVAAAAEACQDSRERVMMALMLLAGLRCSEVARLRRSDLDLGAGLMIVKGKGQHQRELPIVSQLERELQAFFATEPCTMSDFVIRSRIDGKSPISPKTISSIFSVRMKEAGIKQGPYDGKSCHALRHTMVGAMLDRGYDLRDAQEACGHAHLSTTANVYARRKAAMGRLREAMENRDYMSA